MDIYLKFVNQTNDANNSEYVIFQRNVATGFDELAVAWKVIKNCGQGDFHPFVYPMSMQVSAEDSYGNYTPRLDAQDGQLFSMVRTSSDDILKLAGNGSSPTEVQVSNDLPQGAINANFFKSGRLLATRTSLAPQQKAAFEFKPTLWIGVASEIDEGQVMNPAILSNIDTELSLEGLASADIVATGGGSGPSAEPFQFTLHNVVMV